MCLPEVDDDHWLSNLEASGWLKHIKMVIAGAVKIVDKVNFFSCHRGHRGSVSTERRTEHRS